jgi:hypothetical protein
MGEIDNEVHYMVEYECNIRSNLIIKSIIVFCEIISLLTDVGRTVEKYASDT